MDDDANGNVDVSETDGVSELLLKLILKIRQLIDLCSLLNSLLVFD